MVSLAMYRISRKWKRKSDSAPPCCGHWVYTCRVQSTYIEMTEKEYKEWKKAIIIEEWEK